MKPLYLFLFFFITGSAYADSLNVYGFKQIPNDLSAQQFERKDANDKVCALIKVISDIDNLNFDSGVKIIGNIEKKSGEYWVFVSPGERRLSIWGQELMKYNYNLPLDVKSAKVYQMIVTRKSAGGVNGIATGFILLKSIPSGAKVWIDGEYMGNTPFNTELPSRYYEYRIEKEMFYEKEGNFTIKINETETQEVTLNPNFGSLSISSAPLSGAKISLNGVPTSYVTPHTFDALTSGEYNISLSLELYEPINRTITVRDGQNTTLNMDLNPVFGNVNITTQPDAEIYIDGQLKASKSFSDILRKGVHTIEVKKEKYYPQTQKVDMKAGATETLPFTLKPIMGSLSITSNPPEAEIIIDGKSYGLTPKIIPEIMIGSYEITLKKDKYATVKTTAVVRENERTKVTEDLSNFTEITINSTPSGANLFLNGKNQGYTKKTLTTNFGKNTIRLSKQGYNDFEDTFTVTEQKNQYSFTMISDQKALAQMDFDKYKKRKMWWMGGAIASAGTGAWFAFSANKAGKDYETATTEATDLYDKMEQHYTYSYVAFGLSGVCAVMTIINLTKQGKAKQKINISAVPLESGGMVSVTMKF